MISRTRLVDSQAGLPQDVADALDEARLLDLACRHVDPEEHVGRRQPLAEPSRCVRARLAQDPVADRQDRARLFGDLDEAARGDQTALRMLPPNERLDSGQLAGRQVDDRLVGEAKLIELDGPLELDAQLVALADRHVHPGVEDREAALAVGLGHVHRDVGVAHQVGGSLDGVPCARDPDARGHDHRTIADQVRRP